MRWGNCFKGIWIYRPPKVTKYDKDGQKSDLFTERGTIISLQVSIEIVTAAAVEVSQYILLGMYTKINNKQFVTGEKKKCHVKME